MVKKALIIAFIFLGLLYSPALWKHWHTKETQQLLTLKNGAPFRPSRFFCERFPSGMKFSRHANKQGPFQSVSLKVSTSSSSTRGHLSFNPLFFIDTPDSVSLAAPEKQQLWSAQMGNCLKKLSSFMSGIFVHELRLSKSISPTRFKVDHRRQDFLDCSHYTRLFIEKLHLLEPERWNDPISTGAQSRLPAEQTNRIKAKQDADIFLKSPILQVKRCRCDLLKADELKREHCYYRLGRSGVACPKYAVEETLIYHVEDFLLSAQKDLEMFTKKVCPSAIQTDEWGLQKTLECRAFERSALVPEKKMAMALFPSCY